ncbi:13961_t:CDS:2, partial [Dentiscutata erythropus]
NSCNTQEVQNFINNIKKNEENVEVYSGMEAEEIYDNDQVRKRLKKDVVTDEEIASDAFTNENANDISNVFDIDDNQMRELAIEDDLETSINEGEDSLVNDRADGAEHDQERWILSTRKDVYKTLNDYKRTKVRATKAHLYPTYFGILDLTGDDPEVRELFTNEEWTEIQEDFKLIAKLMEMDATEKMVLYELFNKVEEECRIKGHPKINVIRRTIQTYSYNLDRIKNSMSEGSFSSNFTNMMTKGIITYDQKFNYDESEIQSLASAMIANLNKKPLVRSLIGQRCDFRITCDGYEAVIGLRSGGLSEACNSKKWGDKVDLMVAMRDVLLKEAIENNGVECRDFRKLYTLGVHTYGKACIMDFVCMKTLVSEEFCGTLGYHYNLYALDWRAKGLWRLGLLKKISLPQSNDQLLMIEKLTTLLLRIESTLKYIMSIRNELAVKASRLYRNRRSSTFPKPYTFTEKKRVKRTRVRKND